MRDEKDTVFRIERGGGLLTVDEQGVVTISAPVITVSDLVDKPDIGRERSEE